MQTYANLSLLSALCFYAFTDAAAIGKAAKILAIVSVIAFVITEGMALLA